VQPVARSVQLRVQRLRWPEGRVPFGRPVARSCWRWRRALSSAVLTLYTNGSDRPRTTPTAARGGSPPGRRTGRSTRPGPRAGVARQAPAKYRSTTRRLRPSSLYDAAAIEIGAIVANSWRMSRAILAAHKHSLPNTGTHPLTGRQWRMGLGERPPAAFSPETALAPTQISDPVRNREIPYPQHVQPLDLQRPQPHE
jgi:hypothetical protein